MKCAFCLEEMNDGATVCKVCGREQPPTSDSKPKQMLYGGIAIVVAILIIAVPLGWQAMSHSADVDQLVICEHLHGQLIVNRDDVRREIDGQAMGRSWSDGVKAVRLMHLCPID